MPAQLVAMTGGPNILLDKPILLFGRHPECDIQLDSRKISRRHCCIAQVGDYLVIRDLGSTNGLRINGVRVLEGKLRSGDELTIGNYRYQISWDAFAGAMVRPAAALEESEGPGRIGVTSQPDEDELLEACDEPVPLEEDAEDEPRGLPAKKPLQRQTALDDRIEEQPTARPPVPNEDDLSLILPDNLELAPVSDEIRPRNTIRNAPLP